MSNLAVSFIIKICFSYATTNKQYLYKSLNI